MGFLSTCTGQIPRPLRAYGPLRTFEEGGRGFGRSERGFDRMEERSAGEVDDGRARASVRANWVKTGKDLIRTGLPAGKHLDRLELRRARF
jgi:hypothetical protein